MIILKNATYIDWKTLDFKSGHIQINEGLNGKIEFIDNFSSTDKTANIIDCSGKYVTKSFACGHHHVYSALATGMPAPEKKPGNFYEILKKFWWVLDKSLDLEMIKYSAYAVAIACAKSGVTFVIDHHSSPQAIEGSLQTIADAFDEVGVGHLLCYEISDRDGVSIAKKGLAETETYLQNNQGLVGLHASFTLTNKTLVRAVDLAKKYNSGIHVHVAEDIYDQEHCYDIHNQRVVERFQEYGILNLPKSLLVNCLYLTDAERRIIHDSGVYIVQNSESNQNNSRGQFSSCSMGSNIMLGTDGLHSNMLRAAKATFINGQTNDTIDSAHIYNRFRNVHKYLSNNGFGGDDENNLVILDYMPHTYFNQDNFLEHFLYGIEATHVQHVISKGKLIVKNRLLTQVNEAEIKKYAEKLSLKLWQKMEENISIEV